MRSNGEGSHYRRGDGRYVSVLAWTDEEGRLQRKVFYGKTSTEARTKFKEAKQRLEAAQPVTDSPMTLGTWAEYWRTHTLRYSERKPKTVTVYDQLLRTHVVGSSLSSVPLKSLKPSHLDRLKHELKGKLSPASVHKVMGVVSLCLSDAVRDELLAVNPMTKVDRVSVQRPQIVPPTRDEVKRLMRELHGPAGDLLTLIAYTGLRLGEAVALRWDAYNSENKTLRVIATVARIDGSLVESTPKTSKARRLLPLSDAVVALIERQPQRGEYIFSTETGGCLDPSHVQRVMRSAAKRAGVKTNVHGLRHSFTTMALEAGINIRTISDLLGHADVRMALEVYAWTHPETARAAVDGLASMLTGNP